MRTSLLFVPAVLTVVVLVCMCCAAAGHSGRAERRRVQSVARALLHYKLVDVLYNTPSCRVLPICFSATNPPWRPCFPLDLCSHLLTPVLLLVLPLCPVLQATRIDDDVVLEAMVLVGALAGDAN
jgi:hypothetical protein